MVNLSQDRLARQPESIWTVPRGSGNLGGDNDAVAIREIL